MDFAIQNVAELSALPTFIIVTLLIGTGASVISMRKDLDDGTKSLPPISVRSSSPSLTSLVLVPFLGFMCIIFLSTIPLEKIRESWSATHTTLIMFSMWSIVSCMIFFKYSKSFSGMAKRLPPGPRGWPVLGSLLALGKLPDRGLMKMAEKHGPLMFLNLGTVPTLVVSSPEMAKLMFKSHDKITSYRPGNDATEAFFYEGSDVGFGNGEYWKFARKLTSAELLSGTQLAKFQGVRHRQVMTTMQAILHSSRDGAHPIDLANFFVDMAMNHMLRMTVNNEVKATKTSINESDMSSQEAKPSTTSAGATQFLELLRECAELLGAFNLGDYVPFLRPFDLQGYKKRTLDLHGKLDNFCEDIIEEHRQSVGKDTESGDFVDMLLAIQREKESNKLLSHNAVKALFTEMMLAGTDTISTTLGWAVAELIKHPEVMKQAQEELDAVVGRDRVVQEADIPRLKYLHAVLKETLRLHPPAPFLLPREASADFTISGFHISAGTRIIVNAWAIQRDPQAWDKPLDFKPERFLQASLDFKGHDFAMFPFGAGRRICPGMNMGNLMLQLVLAQFLHVITCKPPDGQRAEDLDMSESFGLTVPRAGPLMVLAEPRLASHVIYPAIDELVL